MSLPARLAPVIGYSLLTPNCQWQFRPQQDPNGTSESSLFHQPEGRLREEFAVLSSGWDVRRVRTARPSHRCRPAGVTGTGFLGTDFVEQLSPELCLTSVLSDADSRELSSLLIPTRLSQISIVCANHTLAPLNEPRPELSGMRQFAVRSLVEEATDFDEASSFKVSVASRQPVTHWAPRSRAAQLTRDLCRGMYERMASSLQAMWF